jgi:ribosomal RNA assembly protein
MARETLSIPEERLGVLIGRGGSVKKGIEKATRTSISVKDGIEVEGEPLEAVRAAEIIRAIGRGFPPEDAMLLLDDEYRLHMISLRNESRNTIKRLMGRVIGRSGMTRKKIEDRTGSRISVYGKTVAIIGKAGQVEQASKCIEMLLEGRSHAYAYRALD